MGSDIFKFWASIHAPDHIHPEDRSVLDRVKHGFDLKCLPGAFSGRLRDAPVVLLYLSPGLSEQDYEDAQSLEGRERYVLMRKGHQPLWGPNEHRNAWQWWASRTKCFGAWEKVRHKI